MRPGMTVLIGYGMCFIGAVGSILLALNHLFLVAVALVAGGGLATVLYTKACGRLDAVNRPADEAFTSGYEIGYDKGWCDGRTAAHPKIVPLRRI